MTGRKRRYLRKHAMSTSALARKLRCSKATISVWRWGYYRPGPRLMARLAQVTRGEVSAADFPPPGEPTAWWRFVTNGPNFQNHFGIFAKCTPQRS